MDKGLILTLADIGLPVITALVVLWVGIHVGRIDARNKQSHDENLEEHERLEERIEELARDQRDCRERHDRGGVRERDLKDIKEDISGIFARLNTMATMTAIEDLRTRMNSLETALITLAAKGRD